MKILLVATDRDLLARMESFLGGQGHRVSSVPGAALGLALDEAAPDCIVMDWLMDRLDGIELLIGVRRHPNGRALPVVMLDEEHPFRDLSTEAHGLEVAVVLRKPFELEELGGAVAKATSPAEPRRPSAKPSPAGSPPAPAGQPGLTPGPDDGARRAAARPRPAPRLTAESGPLVSVAEPLEPQGSLRDRPFAELLEAARVGSETGVLTVRGAEGVRRVFVREGRAVSVGSTVEGESLVSRFLSGAQPGGAEREALHRAASLSEAAQSEELVRRGHVAPHELPGLLAAHRAAVLETMVGLRRGEYSFVADRGWERHVVPGGLETTRVVLDGISRHYGEDRLAVPLALPPEARAFVREDARRPVEELALTTAEARTLALVRRARPLREVLGEAPADRLSRARLLHGLFVLGCVGFRHGREGEAPTPAPVEEPRRRERPRRPSPAELLEQDIDRLAGADFLEVLGLGRDAPAAEAHRAFREREPRYRDEALAALPDELRRRGQEVHLRLVEAYRVLTDPARRSSYLDDLAAGETERWEEAVRQKVSRAAQAAAGRPRAQEDGGAAARDKAPEPRAESSRAAGELAAAIAEAQSAIEAGRPRDAVRRLRDVLDAAPEEPMLKAWLAWALFRVSADRYVSEAAGLLESAVAAGPARAEPYLFHARVAAHMGAEELASQMYAEARRRAPEDLELGREAHLFEVRAKKHRSWLRKQEPPARAGEGDRGEQAGPGGGAGKGGSPWNKDLGSIVKGLLGKK